MQSEENRSEPKEPNLSPDGKWRSFPKTPHLLQYVSSGTYYARVKVNGKVIRESLKTSVKTTAQLRLVDFLKEKREAVPETPAPTFEESLASYRGTLLTDTAIKAKTREYRELCILKIQKSFQKLKTGSIADITEQDCRDWASELRKSIASHYFNNTVATLRQIFEHGLKLHRERGGKGLSNPVEAVPRVRVRPKDLKLPEPSRFKELIANVRNESGGWGKGAAELIEFLAYSGLRIYSEAKWVTWEDVDWKRNEIVIRGDPVTHTKNSEVRRIPIIADMAVLLTKMKDEGVASSAPILKVNECQGALTRACKALGLSRLTHHDLRHLFATRCIESGVDIPTVARWLGHKDGGALAMKTYGHLRNEHSQAMAAKVKF